MNCLILYSPNGKILATVDTPGDPKALDISPMLDQHPGALSLVADVRPDMATQYVNQQSLCDRPRMAVTVKGQVLTGLPQGAVLTIEGREYPVDGTPVELSFNLPGRYVLQATCFPYLDWETTLEIAS